MSRLPTVGGDGGNWGTILNDFLSVELNTDGTLKKAVVVEGDLVYNVLDYGATGDGVTDDSAAIQSAITAATSKGRIVYIPANTYIIGSTLSITDKVTIIGDGFNTILKAKNSLNAYVFTFTPPSGGIYATFSDFTINCNGANQTAGGGIMAQGAIHCIFNHLHIDTPWDNGIYLFHDGTSGTGHHNKITNCLFDHGASTNGGAGRAILFEASDENFVARCDFETNGRAATSEPNQIYDKSGLQLFFQNVFVAGQTGIKIQGNNSLIVGNNFDSITNHCVRINGARNVIADNVFYKIGNTASAGTIDGIIIDNVNNNLVTGNQFYSDLTATRSGVNLANTTASTLVQGNMFATQGSGYVTSPVIIGTGNTVKNNVGFVTEASGTATVLAAGTTIAVTHGLGVTPALKNISVTPTTSLFSAASFWISTPTSTQFTINLNATPGTNVDFVWQAQIQ